jgi:hypothetical protein
MYAAQHLAPADAACCGAAELGAVGLLINFNVPVLKQGIRRLVLDHTDY